MNDSANKTPFYSIQITMVFWRKLWNHCIFVTQVFLHKLTITHHIQMFRCWVCLQHYTALLCLTREILLSSTIMWFNEASFSFSHSRWSQRLLCVAGSRKQRVSGGINRRYCCSVFRRFTHAPNLRVINGTSVMNEFCLDTSCWIKRHSNKMRKSNDCNSIQ